MDAVRAQNSEAMRTFDAGSGASGARSEVDPAIAVASLPRTITQGHWAAYRIFSNRNRMRRSGRVVEGDGLENRSASKGRQGFESLLLLHNYNGNPERVPKPSRDGTRRAKLAGSPRDQDGNPERVHFALRPPTRRLLPARFARPRQTLALWLRRAKPAFAYAMPSDLRSGRISSSTKHPRRGGREAEGGGLLNRYTGENLYREFESHPLRQNETCDGQHPADSGG
jgi:hypothetical protein